MIKILFVIILLNNNTNQVLEQIYTEVPTLSVCLEMVDRMKAQTTHNRVFTCRIERVLE